MLTYSFEDRGNDSLYEYLYKQIKTDIIQGRLSADEKLPSKRALAKHLNVSTITVENAYGQLVAEGYIYAIAKSGYYVSRLLPTAPVTTKKAEQTDYEPIKEKPLFADFVNNYTDSRTFPFATWTKLMRETMMEDVDKLMEKSPSCGIMQLRQAIAQYLYQFRGMQVHPQQIVVGAGTEYLYGLLIQLLGREKCYGVEDPGYGKISRIYQANHVSCVHVPIDDSGIRMKQLELSGADIVHISPSHHFPTGIVMPVTRRYELLAWANEKEGRYIIEDDYDSEFRLLGKPIPTMYSIEAQEKVIYMNTFSKSLSSTIRISYMVLPKTLMERYEKELSFYACTVSNFEQYTLSKFIRRGYMEKHINRMRNYYRTQRDEMLSCMKQQPKVKQVTIREEHAGLHFLMEVKTEYSDEELVQRAREHGIGISCLSQYIYDETEKKEHVVVVNYSGVKRERIREAVVRLFESF